MRKKILVMATIGILVLTTFIQSAIVTIVGQEEPLYGGTLIVGLTAEPRSLNPALDTNPQAIDCFNTIFNTLVNHDIEGNAVPELAESWEISADKLSYTFHLVHNVKWHDGEPFTSADVKFSLENMMIPYHSYGRPLLEPVVESVDTPDDYTAVIKLKKRFPLLLFLWNLGFVMPKHLYEGTDILENPHNREPIGTGPFTFKGWVEGSHVTVERNENYWKEGMPYLDKIVFKVIPEVASLVTTFEAREIDYAPVYFPILELERVNAISGARVLGYSNNYAGCSLIYFNLRSPRPTSNLKVRQAILYAMDREEIIDKAYFGSGNTDQETFIPHSGVTDWCYNHDVHLPEHNITKANQLLDEAGYPKGADGKRFTLKYVCVTSWPETVKVAEVVKSQLEAVGITVEIKGYTVAAVSDVVDIQSEFDLFNNYVGPAMNPIYFEMKFRSTNISPEVEPATWRNPIFYNNSRVDELFDLAKEEPDNPEYWREMQEIIAQDIPVIPLNRRTYVDAWWEDTWMITPMPPPWLATTHEDTWWIKGEAPPAPGIEPWIYWGIGIVVVVIVAAGITIWIKRRK